MSIQMATMLRQEITQAELRMIDRMKAERKALEDVIDELRAAIASVERRIINETKKKRGLPEVQPENSELPEVLRRSPNGSA